MALIDDVRATCQRLASHGWAELLARHGLDITAPDLAGELAKELSVDRRARGFGDFAQEGRRGIEPGHPARSLLYHAVASPKVLTGPDGLRLTAFPTPAEIDAVESYVFGVRPPTLAELRRRAGDVPLAVVVLAAEYRPASQTCHKRHADLVFSRTGVSRVGTAAPLYDPQHRGFLPHVEDDPFAVRVSPARYAAYLAVPQSGSEAAFCPMRFRVAGDNPDGRSDAEREFWMPIHKLFSGRECLRDLDLRVELRAHHVNEKLRRIHLALRRPARPGDPPNDTGWDEPDISNPPFVFTVGIAEWSTDPEHGPGLLVPVVRPRLVEPAEYQGRPLTFNVPRGAPVLSSSIEIPWDDGALHAPEYVHARRRVLPDGRQEDLNQSRDVQGLVQAGRYQALHFLDFTGDGWIAASCPELAGRPELRFLPAYSLVTAPDFFPTCDQRELTEWTDTLPAALRGDIWRIPPDTLSDQRMAANLQLPDNPFDRDDTTMTAIVSMFGEVSSQQTATPPGDTMRHSPLPDDSAGVFAPGWDVSRDRLPDGTWHLSAYGLGSPFPEDAKLCAALSTFWPAVAPDSTRTFTYGPAQGWHTVSPLTDAEIGQVGAMPWDGVAGPRVVTGGTSTFAEYASFDHVDYVETALQNRFSLRVTAHIDVEEYQNRVLAMALVYRALGGAKTDWIVLSFRAVSPGDPELQQAQQQAGLTLPGDVYRFEVFANGPVTTPREDFTKRRIRITNRRALLADPVNRRVLRQNRAGRWEAAPGVPF